MLLGMLTRARWPAVSSTASAAATHHKTTVKMCHRHQLQFMECGCFVLKLTEHGNWLQQFTWTLCGQLAGGICSDWQPSEEVFLKHRPQAPSGDDRARAKPAGPRTGSGGGTRLERVFSCSHPLAFFAIDPKLSFGILGLLRLMDWPNCPLTAYLTQSNTLWYFPNNSHHAQTHTTAVSSASALS